jgi:hypothetical protein
MVSIDQMKKKHLQNQPDRISEGAANGLKLLPFASAFLLAFLLTAATTGRTQVVFCIITVVTLIAMYNRDEIANAVRYFFRK